MSAKTDCHAAAAASEVERIAAAASLRETPCGDGTMPWRSWGTGAPLVLLHGGSGSWTHWIRNIEYFARRHRVVAPDLPGLGDATSLPATAGVDAVANTCADGIDAVVGAERIDLVAFSWGCTVAGAVAARLGARVRSLLLVGPAALGADRWGSMQPLRRRWRGMTDDDLWQINRDNLARLMIGEPERIDTLAVYLQVENTRRSRFDSPQFARTTLLFDALCATTCPLRVVYGDRDAPVAPEFPSRRERVLAARHDAEFDVVPGYGHWLQYEWAGFNDYLSSWLAVTSRGPTP
jgi:pimeloyl-ACP methyl ester carboxylesterase